MSSQPANDRVTHREPTAAERAATLWVARCDAGLTPSQQLQFQQWLAEDPRHFELFEEYDGAWALFDHLRESPLPATAPPVPVRESALEIDRAHEDRSGWTVLWRHTVSGWIAASLVAAAIVAFGYIGWWRPIYFEKTVTSEIGHFERITLPDGSLIELNTDSGVSVSYSLTERRVRLERGEAHFTVASNPRRSFVVVANGVAIRAVGTAFNVRLNAGAIEVLVTAGAVQVADAEKGESLLHAPEDSSGRSPVIQADSVLSAGRRVVIPAPSSTPGPAVPAILTATQVQRELAWKQHRLEFVSATLTEIAAEFNRYNHQKLVIGDEQISVRRFGGSFQANDPARFVRMLREEFSVLVDERGDKFILKSGR